MVKAKMLPINLSSYRHPVRMSRCYCPVRTLGPSVVAGSTHVASFRWNVGLRLAIKYG